MRVNVGLVLTVALKSVALVITIVQVMTLRLEGLLFYSVGRRATLKRIHLPKLLLRRLGGILGSIEIVVTRRALVELLLHGLMVMLGRLTA